MKTRDLKVVPFAELGRLVAEGRKKVGISHQADLAVLLGLSQQTVSRWEAGTSRPRASQIALLAKAIQTDEERLLRAAGYISSNAPPPVATSATLDQPFPIDALSPESFERFVEWILRPLFRDAREIRRAGKSGHAQGGIDVLVVLPDQQRLTFQCKRVNRFGPSDVEAAVRAHTETAARKHLVLSRVASPQTAEAVRRHADWELWDKEDISRRIREGLARDEQIRLVDTFFPGKRFALLGVSEPGPWLTVDEFFAPFDGKQATFSHSWSLIGREMDVAAIVEALTTEPKRIVLLSAAGGVGKSRILKRVAEILLTNQPSVTVRFLSPTETVTAQSLENLGRAPKVLVVDDAHDRNDLGALFAYAADKSRNARLVIATRPYARTKIMGQAGVFALADRLSQVDLPRLSLSDTKRLAEEVLNEFGAARELADHIARATLDDCPLVTVMAARIVAKEKLRLALVHDHDALRTTILGKFAQIITGELAPPGEQKQIASVIKVLALVQPFAIDDVEFRKLLAEAAHLDDDAISSTLRLLIDGGIVFRRGAQYRLMPDLLGDYIIEQNCIADGERLTSFAEKVFDAATYPYLGHVLVNLGRLDWRRNKGDASKSHLLDGLWRRLVSANQLRNAAVEAAQAAAYYQPRQAFEFVASLVRQGLNDDKLSVILKNVAYNLDFITDVCEMLWRMGAGDSRELSRHPNHAIRVLSELCAVEPQKPTDYNEKVVTFGLGLIKDDKSFDGAFTPLEFLKSILIGEGHTTTTTGHTLNMAPFVVRYEAVASLRAKVIQAALSLLEGRAAKISVYGAQFLHHALRYPMAILGISIPDAVRDKYTCEFLTTLKMLQRLVKSYDLDPVVLISIVHSISWHANYGPKETGAVARAIMKSLPETLEFRALAGLADGFGQIFIGRFESKTWQSRLDQWIGALASDLSAAYANAPRLRRFLDNCLNRMLAAGMTRNGSEHVLILEVLRQRPDLAADVVENALNEPQSPLAATPFLSTALHRLLETDRAAGRRRARRFLDTGQNEFQAAVGHAFYDPPLNGGTLQQEDAEILLRVLASPHSGVAHSGLRAIGMIARQQPRLAIDLLKRTNLGLDHRLADQAFMYLQFDGGKVFEMLAEDDVEFVLSQLENLPELNGHWIETVLAQLSFRFPDRTCAFFIRRVEHGATEKNFSDFRPCNHGPYSNVPLRFRESERFDTLLGKVWSWMIALPAGDWRFEMHAAELFEVMFLPVDARLINFFSVKLPTATKQDLRWMANTLSHAECDFVFTNQSFVVNFLDACERAGEATCRKGIDCLVRAAISGVRSGTFGKPFQQDQDAIVAVEAILPRLPRISPAFQLYDLIRRHAEQGIDFQRQQAEFFDDE